MVCEVFRSFQRCTKLSEVNEVTREIRRHPVITVDTVNRANTVRGYPNYSKGVQSEKRILICLPKLHVKRDTKVSKLYEVITVERNHQS